MIRNDQLFVLDKGQKYTKWTEVCTFECEWTASYLFLVPHHSIFHFGSHLHVPSPRLGHLRLKTQTHSDREREQCEPRSNELRGRKTWVYIPGRQVCLDNSQRREGVKEGHTLAHTCLCYSAFQKTWHTYTSSALFMSIHSIIFLLNHTQT